MAPWATRPHKCVRADSTQSSKSKAKAKALTLKLVKVTKVTNTTHHQMSNNKTTNTSIFPTISISLCVAKNSIAFAYFVGDVYATSMDTTCMMVSSLGTPFLSRCINTGVSPTDFKMGMICSVHVNPIFRSTESSAAQSSSSGEHKHHSMVNINIM